MRTSIAFILCLAAFAMAGLAKAEDPIMTPDGYLGYPAFEFGVNGDPNGFKSSEAYSYTNYTNLGAITGNGKYNYNRVFLDVYFPVSTTLTFVCGGSFLFNSSGYFSSQTTANNFTGTENYSATYSYVDTLSWYFSMKVYTK